MRVSYRFLIANILVGIISGIICVAFRYFISLIDNIRFILFRINDLSDFQKITTTHQTVSDILLLLSKYFLLFIITAVILNFIDVLVKRFPTTSGSGLPQTKALLEGKMEYKSPLKNIVAKFIGGTLSITSGLSFGREGSSVQMGSLIGYIFGRSLKIDKENENYLIAAGAGAGISAAFTSPLASSILILESLRNRNTSDLKKLTIATLLSGLCAGIVAVFFFPENIYSSITIIKPELKESYIMIVLLMMSVVFALLGKVFSDLFIYIKTRYESIKTRYDKHYILVSLMICVIIFFYPSLVGGNQAFTIEIIENNSYSFLNNMLIIIILSSITIISNATGFPGGLFIPLLSIGGLLGKIFCITLAHFEIVSLCNTGYFVMIGMSVFLIAVVRTPLTGFVLISEMTGNYEVMFPTLVVGILTYIITEIVKVRPLDDILYDMMMRKEINNGSSCS